MLRVGLIGSTSLRSSALPGPIFRPTWTGSQTLPIVRADDLPQTLPDLSPICADSAGTSRNSLRNGGGEERPVSRRHAASTRSTPLPGYDSSSDCRPKLAGLRVLSSRRRSWPGTYMQPSFLTVL
jgi:hypothetical protein